MCVIWILNYEMIPALESLCTIFINITSTFRYLYKRYINYFLSILRKKNLLFQYSSNNVLRFLILPIVSVNGEFFHVIQYTSVNLQPNLWESLTLNARKIFIAPLSQINYFFVCNKMCILILKLHIILHYLFLLDGNKIVLYCNI